MRTKIGAAAGLLVVGSIWIGQGLGLLAGTSFMVGDQRWAFAGAVLIAIGLVLAVSARIRRPPV
ncbi:MAG: hypothetical protein ABIP77_08315 [Candidatus Limnocylindrales bacterium]